MAAPQYVIAQVDENGQVRPVGPDNPLKISGGGGGGGAVASVNGQTGEVVLGIGDVLGDPPNIVEGSSVAFVDDMGNIQYVMSIDAAGVVAQDVMDDRDASLLADGLRVRAGLNSASLLAPESGGDSITVRLPSSSGTLALESQIQAPTLDDVLEQGNETALSIQIIEEKPGQTYLTELTGEVIRASADLDLVGSFETTYTSMGIRHVPDHLTESEGANLVFSDSTLAPNVNWFLPNHSGVIMTNQKPEIQALTPESTIADIVAALQA